MRKEPGTVGWLAVDSKPTRRASLIDRSSRFNASSMPSSAIAHVTCCIGLVSLCLMFREVGDLGSTRHKNICLLLELAVQMSFDQSNAAGQKDCHSEGIGD